jgi:hypothetical protein
MRTTIRLDEELLAEAKAYAARHHRTLTSLIEEALRQRLAELDKYRAHPRKSLPTSTAGGGTRPGVDLDDTAALLDVMDEHAAS